MQLLTADEKMSSSKIKADVSFAAVPPEPGWGERGSAPIAFPTPAESWDTALPNVDIHQCY